MTSFPEPQDMVRGWLREELDAVPEPHRAVQAAVMSASSVSQRRPRRSLRERLTGLRRPSTAVPTIPPPSVILWAEHPADARATAAPQRAAEATGLSLVSVLVIVGLAGVLMTAFLVLAMRPSSPFGGATLGQASPTPRPALVLEPPTEDGRQIVVDAQGQGHFWTITEAVAAAVDGDVISVRPGTYRESVIVSGDVDIVGEGGVDRVIVSPGQPGLRGPGNWDDALARAVSLRDGFVILDMRADEAEVTPDILDKGWRFVFYLVESDARISGLTLRGSEVGTAILVDGGDPVLSELVVDPDGQQRNKTAADPHEAIAVGQASRATIRDSTIRAFVSLGEGSRATVSGNDFQGTCLVIGGEGTEALVSGNHFEGSECPRYHIWVMDGASPTIESNTIVGDRQTDGIKATGAGTNVTIEGNVLSGGDTGIWIGGGAGGRVARNHVAEARTGIGIVGSAPVIHSNELHDNDVGVLADERATPELSGDNVLCGNAADIDVRGDSVMPAAAFGTCPGPSGA